MRYLVKKNIDFLNELRTPRNCASRLGSESEFHIFMLLAQFDL